MQTGVTQLKQSRMSFDFSTRESLSAFLKKLQQRFTEIENYGEDMQFSDKPKELSPLIRTLSEAKLEPGVMTDIIAGTWRVDHNSSSYQKGARIAIAGQNLYLFAVTLDDFVCGRRPSADDVRRQIEFIDNDARGYGLISELFGVGKGAELRQEMAKLGHHCLDFVANQRGELFEMTRDMLKMDLNGSLNPGIPTP